MKSESQIRFLMESLKMLEIPCIDNNISQFRKALEWVLSESNNVELVK